MKKSTNWAAADDSPLPSSRASNREGVPDGVSMRTSFMCACFICQHSTKGQNTFLVIANTAAFHTPLKYQ